VQSLTVNGIECNKNWLTREDLVAGEGGKIQFIRGSKWDVGDFTAESRTVRLWKKNLNVRGRWMNIFNIQVKGDDSSIAPGI
jgi:hypothetical protein